MFQLKVEYAYIAGTSVDIYQQCGCLRYLDSLWDRADIVSLQALLWDEESVRTLGCAGCRMTLERTTKSRHARVRTCSKKSQNIYQVSYVRSTAVVKYSQYECKYV